MQMQQRILIKLEVGPGIGDERFAWTRARTHTHTHTHAQTCTQDGRGPLEPMRLTSNGIEFYILYNKFIAFVSIYLLKPNHVHLLRYHTAIYLLHAYSATFCAILFTKYNILCGFCSIFFLFKCFCVGRYTRTSKSSRIKCTNQNERPKCISQK